MPCESMPSLSAVISTSAQTAARTSGRVSPMVSVKMMQRLAQRNRELAANHGVTVWLDCDFERIARRVAQADHRPLARDPAKLAELFDARRDVYRLADIHIPVKTDDAEAVAGAILAHPFF